MATMADPEILKKGGRQKTMYQPRSHLLQTHTTNYRVAKKVSHYQMIKKFYWIVLKNVNEIRFIRKNKVRIK